MTKSKRTESPPEIVAVGPARRRTAAAMRAEHAARERRRRTLLRGIGAAVVLAAVVGIGIAVQAQRNAVDGPTVAPSGLTADGGFLVGQAAAPVEVLVYEDFQCPACAAFEEQSGSALAELVQSGAIRVEYRPIAFLDRASTDRYSTRALNAAACLIDTAPGAFPGFHEALFAHQPSEGGPGLSDNQLVSLAVEAGADENQVHDCVTAMGFENWTRQATDEASRSGINQTPAVLVDGQRLARWSPQGIRAAVEAARTQ